MSNAILKKHGDDDGSGSNPSADPSADPPPQHDIILQITIPLVFSIEDMEGNIYRAEALGDTFVHDIANDFAESRGWQIHNASDISLFIAVELVDPENRNNIRLDPHQTLSDAGIQTGSTLRIQQIPMLKSSALESDTVSSI